MLPDGSTPWEAGPLKAIDLGFAAANLGALRIENLQ